MFILSFWYTGWAHTITPLHILGWCYRFPPTKMKCLFPDSVKRPCGQMSLHRDTSESSSDTDYSGRQHMRFSDPHSSYNNDIDSYNDYSHNSFDHYNMRRDKYVSDYNGGQSWYSIGARCSWKARLTWLTLTCMRPIVVYYLTVVVFMCNQVQ